MRLDVLVNDRPAMDGGDRARHANRDIEEPFQRRAFVPKHRFERHIAEILQHQRDAPAVLDEPEGANHLGRVERRQDRVLMTESSDLRGGRMLRPKQLHDHRAPSASRLPLSKQALCVSRTVSVSV